MTKKDKLIYCEKRDWWEIIDYYPCKLSKEEICLYGDYKIEENGISFCRVGGVITIKNLKYVVNNKV